MQAALCLLVLVTSMASADDTKEKDKDVKALQGKWSVVKGVDRGKPVPPKELEGVEIEFKDSMYIIWEGKKEVKTTFTLDLSQKPKVMKLDTPDNEPKMVEMIYEIDGDDLKLAFTKCGGDRPKSFEVKEGIDVQIMILKRKKK